MRLGLFGGSFDPVHLGHLLAASEAADRLNLARVEFVTAARPPHKRPVAPPEARHEMVVLAVGKDERFYPSRLELDRPGTSYTVDTLREARKRWPEAELYFITGADAYRELATWKEPEEMFRLAKMVAVTRPGYDLSRLDPFFRERVLVLEIPGYEVSSSEVRRRVAEGRTIRYLVPFEVEVYIARHGLYRP